jgi:aryl-alcohol dehydrogenase-like predicted oxidoreductase
MIGDAEDCHARDRRRAVLARALQAGINWFDTAATYGQGQSEANLGRVLEELDAAPRVHVATKVRLTADDLCDVRGAVRRSFEASLERLRLSQVTLLQLHNAVTLRRGDEPTSITPDDVLAPGGVAEAFEELRAEGRVLHLGLTGIGRPESLAEVVRSGRFETMQTPYHLLNPSAGREMEDGFPETNYGNIIGQCARMGMGVLAIRVLAAGALAGSPPSPHTCKTPFFPLALYERDRSRTARLKEAFGPQCRLPCEAVRFALDHPQINSALIGFGETWQIDEAMEALEAKAPFADSEAALGTAASIAG